MYAWWEQRIDDLRNQYLEDKARAFRADTRTELR
jgi:hypothetical protein